MSLYSNNMDDSDTIPIGSPHETNPAQQEKKVPPENLIPPGYMGTENPEYLANGSSGTVYMMGKDHILKIINCGSDPLKKKAAQHELEIMKSLKSVPGTVGMIDGILLEDEGKWVCSIIEPRYTSLLEYLETHTFTESDTLRLGSSLCTTLERLLQVGILHLDIQPKNIYFDSKGSYLLGDFGSALRISELDRDEYLRGTKAYMAPEVYHFRKYSVQSEIYSLAMVLYCLLNRGALPLMEIYGAEKAVERRLDGEAVPPLKDHSESVNRALLKALNIDPGARFDSFASFNRALAEANKGTYVTAPRPRRRSSEEPAKTPANSGSSFSTGKTEIADGFAEFDAEPFAISAALPSADPRPSSGETDIGHAAAEKFMEFDAEPFASTAFLTPSDSPLSDSGPTNNPRVTANKQETPPPDYDALRRSPKKGGIFSRLFGGLFGKKQPDRQSDVAVQSASAPLSSIPTLSEVQFSALFPEHFIKGDYSILEMIMYEEAYRQIVDEAIASAENAVKEMHGSPMRVADSTIVTVHLECSDKRVVILGNDEPQKWVGKFLKFSFSVFPDAELPDQQLMFTASVFFNGVIASHLRFIAKCGSPYQQKLKLMRNDILSAFISYSREDLNHVVPTIQGMRTARPDLDIFFDLDSIHTGEYWEKVLRTEIEKRDVLYLCWSRAAQKSEWVSKEWHYALEKKGLDGIEPIAIDQPDVCPPPEELSSKHFNDRMLFFMKKE